MDRSPRTFAAIFEGFSRVCDDFSGRPVRLLEWLAPNGLTTRQWPSDTGGLDGPGRPYHLRPSRAARRSSHRRAWITPIGFQCTNCDRIVRPRAQLMACPSIPCRRFTPSRAATIGQPRRGCGRVRSDWATVRGWAMRVVQRYG
jgi:hypothetical protein